MTIHREGYTTIFIAFLFVAVMLLTFNHIFPGTNVVSRRIVFCGVMVFYYDSKVFPGPRTKH